MTCIRRCNIRRDFSNFNFLLTWQFFIESKLKLTYHEVFISCGNERETMFGNYNFVSDAPFLCLSSFFSFEKSYLFLEPLIESSPVIIRISSKI